MKTYNKEIAEYFCLTFISVYYFVSFLFVFFVQICSSMITQCRIVPCVSNTWLTSILFTFFFKGAEFFFHVDNIIPCNRTFFFCFHILSFWFGKLVKPVIKNYPIKIFSTRNEYRPAHISVVKTENIEKHQLEAGNYWRKQLSHGLGNWTTL